MEENLDIHETILYKLDEVIQIVDNCGWKRSETMHHLRFAREIVKTSHELNKGIGKQTEKIYPEV